MASFLCVLFCSELNYCYFCKHNSMNMTYDIFISYSRHDTTVVDEFVAILEGEGFSVWIDRDGIESGDAFKRKILRAIKESQVVLFFSSEHSNQSDWTAKEIGVAVKYKKHIIPIKLDGSNFNEDIEFDLINLDYIDYSIVSTRLKLKERLLKTLRNKLRKGKEYIGAERIAQKETERLKLVQEQKEREEVEHKAIEEVERERNNQEKAIKENGRMAEQEGIEVNRNNNPVCPDGVVNGVFSVSPTEKVFFSKGNLRYQTGTRIWRFAVNQYDCIGQGNAIISKANTNWIDLFGWGTGDNPTKFSRWTGGYSGFLDWGKNKICNGDNKSSLWRTLTKKEWEYVIDIRNTTSGVRFAKAQVNNVNGVIMLPDDWEVHFYNLNNANQREGNFSDNVIDSYTWDSALQAHGAIFLPAAGIREGRSVCYEGSRGYYWSASPKSNNSAYGLYFNDGDFYPANYGSISSGYAVRLVCSAE